MSRSLPSRWPKSRAEMKLTRSDPGRAACCRSARNCSQFASKRPRPRTDTKILTAENGLMIGGLADAGRILKEPRYVAAAEKAADFVLTKLRTAGRPPASLASPAAKPASMPI